MSHSAGILQTQLRQNGNLHSDMATEIGLASSALSARPEINRAEPRSRRGGTPTAAIAWRYLCKLIRLSLQCAKALAFAVRQRLAGHEKSNTMVSVRPPYHLEAPTDSAGTSRENYTVDFVCSMIDISGIAASNPGSTNHQLTTLDLSGHVWKDQRPIFIGWYSKVYFGRYGSRKVAIKVLRTVKSNDTTTRKFRRERFIWSQLRHPNVVPLYGYFDHDDGIETSHALVSEWAEGGSAAQYIRRDLSWDRRMSLVHDVAKGLKYLHTFRWPVVHGDIKPLNVLINKGGIAQLCDFGLARFTEYESGSGMTTTTAHTGTLRYLAYELVRYSGEAMPTTATDVYAFGCLALEFLYQTAPHSTLNNRFDIPWAIREGKPPAERPANSDRLVTIIWDLFEPCWSVDPDERPAAEDICCYLDENIGTLSTILPRSQAF